MIHLGMSRSAGRSPAAGFTLLELVVAMGLFAVVSVMTYSSLRAMLDSRQRVEEEAGRLAAVQITMARLTRDLAQATERGIRDEFGNRQPALILHSFRGDGLEFTVGGRRNPTGKKRSSLQRVVYRLDNGELLRGSWPVLDRDVAAKPFSQPLLDKVVRFQVRFLDVAGTWHDEWPLPAAADQDLLPRAVEVWLELEDWRRLRRLVPLVGKT
jgi:general secretion pathway protein J